MGDSFGWRAYDSRDIEKQVITKILKIRRLNACDFSPHTPSMRLHVGTKHHQENKKQLIKKLKQE